MALAVSIEEQRQINRTVPATKFLRLAEVTELVGLSRSMIYKIMKDPEIQFPAPIKIGIASRWDRDEIFRWTEHIRVKVRSKTKTP